MTDLETRIARALCEDACFIDAGDEERYRKHARAIIAACFEWQPIETAPRDGTAILSYRHDDEEYPLYQVLQWHTEGEEWLDLASGWYYSADTLFHWMPLPLPPQPKPDNKA